jgi:hypothetical protein
MPASVPSEPSFIPRSPPALVDGRRDTETVRAAFAQCFGQPLRICRCTLAAGRAGGV